MNFFGLGGANKILLGSIKYHKDCNKLERVMVSFLSRRNKEIINDIEKMGYRISYSRGILLLLHPWKFTILYLN